MADENMSQEEQVGFHKGSISVLMKEREELLKIVKVTEQIAQAHVNALKELGIDLDNVEKPKEKTKKKVDIEDLI